MAKNYEALHYIRDQLSGYTEDASIAIQRLFDIEDRNRESQGCVIDSVIAKLILKKFGIESKIHLGEFTTDNYHWFHHCWLTVSGKVVDMGIYGNSTYNERYRGKLVKSPIVLENPEFAQYKDGTNDRFGWILGLSGISFSEYTKNCPGDRVYKIFCKSLDILENKESKKLFSELTEGEFFPNLN